MSRHDLIGYVDPSGKGEGNWYGREPHYRRHPSEKLVMDRLGRRYRRTPRTIRALPLRSVRDTRIPPVRLLNILLSVAFLEVMVIVWALHKLGVFG